MRMLTIAAIGAAVVVGSTNLASAATAGADLAAAENLGTPSNPNGVWSYGYTGTLGQITLQPFHTDTWVGNSQMEGFHEPNDVAVPATVVNVGPGSTTMSFAPGGPIEEGEMVVHGWQGAGSQGGTLDYAVVRYTAPVAGVYSVDTYWRPIHVSDSGSGHVVVNGSTVFSQPMGAVNTPVTYNNPSVSLLPGDTVDFAFGPIGASTAFDATVTLVPEPAALSLIGLAGAGLLARRRRP